MDKKNYVVIDLVKYDDLIKKVVELESSVKKLNFENKILNNEIKNLNEDRNIMSEEIRDILDAIVDDNIIYTDKSDKFLSYDISLSNKIADYLNDNDYLEMVKEIKKAKLETKLINDNKETKEGANNE